MKKSKIVIPALGIIAVSAAASITGSIAWFTANRTASISTDAFMVTNTDGSLSHTLTAGIGTQLTSDNTVVSPKSGAQLTDASFNPVTTTLWTNNEGGDTSFSALGGSTEYQADESVTDTSGETPVTTYSHFVYSSTQSIYYAYTWKINLTLDNPTTYSKMNVFFDATTTGSSMTPLKADGTAATNQTSKGFRIAIINPGVSTIVFGKLEEYSEEISESTRYNFGAVTANNAGSVKYNQAGLNSGFKFFTKDSYGIAGSDVMTYSANPIAKATDTEANQSSRVDYVGTMQSGSASLTLYCVAWYEGTDPNVVNGKDLEKVSSVLKFYSTNEAL